MIKTKIDWCDFSWNPVTGCLHGCEYCYARKQARRYYPELVEKLRDTDKGPLCLGFEKCGPVKSMAPVVAFNPMFWPARLNEPAKRKKPARIFVVSMGDLFGKWVPDSWIEQVFKACEAAPQHTYYFLTKNRVRYRTGYLAEIWRERLQPRDKKWWWGYSETGLQYPVDRELSCKFNEFVSIEPLLGQIEIRENLAPNWIIVGAQTNPLVLPKKEWVLDIRKQCADLKIPLFEKNSLEDLELPGGLIQQWPDNESAK